MYPSKTKHGCARDYYRQNGVIDCIYLSVCPFFFFYLCCILLTEVSNKDHQSSLSAAPTKRLLTVLRMRSCTRVAITSRQ